MSRRTYEDYEELGKHLEAVFAALGPLQQQLAYMWWTEDPDGNPLPSYDVLALRARLALDELHSKMVMEFGTEFPDTEPPPPFDRGDYRA